MEEVPTELPEEAIDSIAEKVIEFVVEKRLHDKLRAEQQPLIDAIRWVAIGIGIANRPFLKRLSDEVGFRAFNGASDDAFSCLESTLADDSITEISQSVLCKVLGIRAGDREKLSNAILRVLRIEAKEVWENIQLPRDQRRLAELSRRIHQDAADLSAMCKRLETRFQPHFNEESEP
jgi:hypothetical protein